MKSLLRGCGALVSLSAIVLTSGCGTIQEAGGILNRSEACSEATEIADGLLSKMPHLVSDPAQLEKALNEAAAQLEKAGVKSGDTTLNEALGGLARAYKAIVANVESSATAAAEKVRSDTTSYFQVINRACNNL